MSVELEEALPPTGADARKAARGAPAAPARKRKNRKKNQPGKYSQLVVETIRRLGERGGSSLARVYAEAKKVPWFDQQNGRTYLKYSIRALVQNDTLLQVKGTGANGSFKLNRKKLEAGAGRGAASPPPAAPQAGRAAPQAGRAAGGARADTRPAGARPDRRAPPKGKGAGAPKAAAAGAKKVKKAAKPSVPKVPKGRK